MKTLVTLIIAITMFSVSSAQDRPFVLASWTPSQTTGETVIDRYKVEIQHQDDMQWTHLRKVPPDTDANGLVTIRYSFDPSRIHRIRVQAVSTGGKFSEWSEPSDWYSVITIERPGKPKIYAVEVVNGP